MTERIIYAQGKADDNGDKQGGVYPWLWRRLMNHAERKREREREGEKK